MTRTAKCRHCGAEIHETETGWADTDGMSVCVKGNLEVPYSFVFHFPMPDGFPGAPA